MLIHILLKRAIIDHDVFLKILVDMGNDIRVKMSEANQRRLRIVWLFWNVLAEFYKP